MNITAALNFLVPTLSLFFAVCITAGSVIAFRKTYATSIAAVQERVIAAQKTETDFLRTKMSDLEREIMRLSTILEMVQTGLKQKGIHITIEGEFVTIEDKRSARGKSTTSKIRPLRLQPNTPPVAGESLQH